jgi:hypothetical protein
MDFQASSQWQQGARGAARITRRPRRKHERAMYAPTFFVVFLAAIRKGVYDEF